MQTESPIGPGYYPNLPTAFDTVLKKPASKVFGETRHTLHGLLFRDFSSSGFLHHHRRRHDHMQ